MDGERTRLVVVAGLDRGATEAVCDRLMRAEPGTVVAHHDMRAIAEGVVHRRLRSGDAEATDVLELAHGCVSCTLREDVLPLLRRLADRPDVRRIVLHLDPVMEPEPVCWNLASVVVEGETDAVTVTDLVSIDAVLAMVDEDTWLSAATSDVHLDELTDRDLGVTPDEDRTLAQVAVGQVAFADAIVVAGRATDSPLAVAVAVKGTDAAAYLCDGANLEAWLKGTAADGEVEVASADGATTLTAALEGETLTGEVTFNGQTQAFSIGVAQAPAGLYRGEGADATIGWIVLPDGTQVGILRSGGARSPAPPLDPARGEVAVSGATVSAEKVSGDTTFG